MFLINLFIGVVFYNFTLAQKNSKHKFLSDSQLNWLRIQRLIQKCEPKILKMNYNEINFLRKFSFKLVSNTHFKNFMNVVIIVSVTILAMTNEGSPEFYKSILSKIEYGCFSIFLFETFLKIFVYNFPKYFMEGSNQIDFFVLLCSASYIYIDHYLKKDLIMLSFGRPLLRFLLTLRILWLLRLMRILKRFKDVQKLLKTLYFSIPMTLNVMSLVLILMFIFTIFGCKYFGGIPNNGSALNNYVNFQNFSYGIMTLFKISTADEWESIMFYIMENNKYAIIYFIIFYVLISFIMINLFILVLIDQFDEYYHNPDNPLHHYDENLRDFRTVWEKYCYEKNALKMDQKKILKFFKDLEKPLGKILNFFLV